MGTPIIGVMGPGETATDRDCAIAFALGQQIAQQKWILLTGGRAAGVMDAASRGAKAAGGLTIGILPGTSNAGMSAAIDIPILTGMDSARNQINILTSQVIIACGMGAGTASEVALALKANKPVILINVDRAGENFFRQLGGDRIQAAAEVAAAIDWAGQIVG